MTKAVVGGPGIIKREPGNAKGKGTFNGLSKRNLFGLIKDPTAKLSCLLCGIYLSHK